MIRINEHHKNAADQGVRLTTSLEIILNIKIGIVLLLLSNSELSYADVAECEIKIEDIKNSVSKKKLVKTYRLESFSFEAGASALTSTQRNYFKLPGNQYNCNLAFVDLSSGISLSCESTENQGYTYFQSEQGGNAGEPNKLFLTFRHASSHFTISALCKKA